MERTTDHRQQQMEAELKELIERFSDLSYIELNYVFDVVIDDLNAEPFER